MSEKDVKPRLKTTDETFGLMARIEIVNWIELEPTLQLMKEMGEAIINEVRLDAKEEVLEKYRKFLEGIKK